MTKDQIKAKIKQLKKQRQRLEYLAEAQDVRQHAYKIFLNSSYGALGSVFYPCYDLDNAQAVTLSGQTVTREMVRFTNELLNKLQNSENNEYVIAGDTDSVWGKTKLNLKKLKALKIKTKEKEITLLPNEKICVKRDNKELYIPAIELKKTDRLVYV